MDNQDLTQAYALVFQDLISSNAPSLFKGKYDAKNGNEKYMYGINAVMEFIAYKADSTEETYNSFSDMFMENMIQSKERNKANE